nr:DUF2490 domain-containing protein [uncultured Carboxylicivirga sp.]
MFLTNTVTAQKKTQFRLYYFGQYPSKGSNRFSFAGGVHYQPETEWFRTEFRTSKVFFLSNKWDLVVSQRTNLLWQYGEFTNIEIRPIQYFTYHHLFLPRFKLDHRLMLEERFFANVKHDNEFHARFRYRLDGRIPMNNLLFMHGKFYMRPMSEVYINFGNSAYNPYVSQWKNTLAIGHLINNRLTLEFRYEKSKNWFSNRAPSVDMDVIRFQFVQKLKK